MDVLGDRYELGATLGAGGMARVVEAHDRVLDRAVAVKLLRDDIATDPTVRERFLREARTAAKFNHPNAVAVYDTGQDGRQPWIVMELVRGEDLSRRLATTGPLEETDAIHVADAVLAALGAAHRDGMVHRDVKPGNIMLLDDGGVKLADFGIAKSVQDATAGMTATGQIIGTAKYLSPEQVEGRPATPASDVYATGVVLYEMLVGSAPYTGDTAIAIALAHTREPVPDVRQPRPEVSPGVAAVIERAMAKDPADRFADAEEMRRALAGESVPAATAAPTAVLAADTPTRVLPNERPTAPSRGDSRGGLWALLALAALLLLGGLFFANQPGEDAPNRDAPGDAATEEPAEQTEAPDDEEQPADDEQPQEPEPTEAEPPPTRPPDPTEEAPAIPAPTDLPTLTSFLEANPDRFGPRQEDLRKGLEKVQDSEDDKQADEAAKLSESVIEWADAGELDEELAAVAFTLLAPLAAASEDDGPGQGKGKGKDKGRNGDKGKGD